MQRTFALICLLLYIFCIKKYNSNTARQEFSSQGIQTKLTNRCRERDRSISCHFNNNRDHKERGTDTLNGHKSLMLICSSVLSFAIVWISIIAYLNLRLKEDCFLRKTNQSAQISSAVCILSQKAHLSLIYKNDTIWENYIRTNKVVTYMKVCKSSTSFTGTN